jgi:indolepyruvate ferredoxin oxidoreductase alpha subunit
VNAVVKAEAGTRLLMSGNAAVARGVWEAGARVAASYPGTPATEILEHLGRYPDLYAEWSVNEKVALEVAIGASLSGSRAFCAMKHVGMNVASDAFMTQSLIGAIGGLVIAVADDVGLSSSQNEQDSRYWGRFAHLPVLEPADSQEAYAMVQEAFELSERHDVPVILRLTTRVCHVKAMVTAGERRTYPAGGFRRDVARMVMTPMGAKGRLPLIFGRDERLLGESEGSPLNLLEEGADRRVGFVASGPAYMHVKESFPEAPVLKLGLSHPLPLAKARALAAQVEQLVVVEEVEPLVEQELRAAGLTVHGKEILPRCGELAPATLKPAVAALLEGRREPPTNAYAMPAPVEAHEIFPRPPTLCAACPHLGPFYALSRMRNVHVAGDIGCYTLAAGKPWDAMDTCISMGASMGVALGMDKGRGDEDGNKSIVAVIGDSTFLHMGMQGLLDITYNRGNVTVLLLDNRAVEALGVAPERIRVVDPYELPTVYKALREEVKVPEPSVIITNRPCVLIDHYERRYPYEVIEDQCTGCGNCVEVGCPAIFVTRREQAVKPSGKEVELAFVRIESSACTGCDLCARTCGPKAIVHVREGQA